MKGKIRVGTASWSDPGFVADWSPREVHLIYNNNNSSYAPEAAASTRELIEQLK